MGIFVGIGNYIGRVRQIGDGQPIGPNDYYIITEDGIAVLTERGKHILLDKYVTEDEIATWVKEHMVFWYDMSKPVDVYTQNFNNWENYNPNSVSITNNKIVVNGLIDNFRIASIGKETESFSVFIEGLGDKNLVYRVKLDENSDQITNIKLKDGENVLPHSFATTVAFMGASGVTDYIGLTITQLPSGQSVPTNEILKANPYLQDFSGNNRPLKLNNFLFASMSGVGGYSYFSEDIVKTSSNWYEVLYRGSNNGASLSFSITGITDLNSKNPQRGKIEILDTDASKVIQTIISDGEYNITIPSSTTNFSIRFGGGTQGEVVLCDVVISPIPLYPDSLVTDGVDDYGQVQNLQQGVKTWYIQNTFSVYGQPNTIAYNYNNTGGVTYLDETILTNNLLNKKQTVTIVNPTDGGDNNVLFFNSYGSSYMQMAFYNSVGFDSVPEDSATLQRVIDYVINNILNKA